MPTATRVRVPAVLPDHVPSVAGGPNETGNDSGFHDAVENAGDTTAAEEESGRQHRKKRDDGTPKKEKWEEKFNELVAYNEANGSCNVPYRQGKLGTWVNHQRAFYKEGKLSLERAKELEGVGFNWGTCRDKLWEERFNELVVYKMKNVNCNVPQRQGALGKWVHEQRRFYKKGKLPQERATQLGRIGFNWGTRKKNQDTPWEERFNELVVYKVKNGNCNVPQREGVLGRWVVTQRKIYKKEKLSQERTTQLEGIGFNWGKRKRNDCATG